MWANFEIIFLHWQNSPQKCPYGLYAEHLSGTAFSATRDYNCRRYVWCYQQLAKCNIDEYFIILHCLWLLNILIQCFGSVLLQILLCFAHSLRIMLKVPFANKMLSHVTVKFYCLITFLNPFWKSIQPQYMRFHSIDLWHIVSVYCILTLLCNYVKDDQQSMNRCFGSGSGWSVFKAFYNSTLQYMEKKYPSTERVCRTLTWQSVDI